MGRFLAGRGLAYRCPVQRCNFCHDDLYNISSKARHLGKAHPGFLPGFAWFRQNATIIPYATFKAYKAGHREEYKWGSRARTSRDASDIYIEDDDDDDDEDDDESASDPPPFAGRPQTSSAPTPQEAKAKLNHIEDIITDSKTLVDSGEYSRALNSLQHAEEVDATLPEDIDLGPRAQGLWCQLALLRLKAANGIIGQEDSLPKRLEMPFDRVRSKVTAWAVQSTMSPLISDLERGEAHYEKGKLLCALGKAAGGDANAREDENDDEGSESDDERPDLASKRSCYKEAAKQFYFATKLLAGAKGDLAVRGLQEMVVATHYWLNDERAGHISRKTADNEIWQGDKRLWDLWHQEDEEDEEDEDTIE